MIKSLLDADENPPPETRVIIEETTVEPPSLPSAKMAAREETVFTAEQMAEAEDILEIPSASRPLRESGAAQTNAQNVASAIDRTNFQADSSAFQEQANAQSETVRTTPVPEAPLFQSAYQPETTAETARKSGLAYAAALTLFGAVVFMMIVGWGADLLLGSSPWGIVGGIVIGALIGFVQFFRLSAQIFK